jgi:hypothetical protein
VGKDILSFQNSQSVVPQAATRGSLLRDQKPRNGNDHSHPSSAKVKNEWTYTSAPPIRLNDMDENFTFT